MNSTNTASPPKTQSRQPISTTHSSDSNHFALAISQFKSVVINPATNIIRRTTPTQQIIALIMLAPILFLPAIFTIFFVPFLLFVVIIVYILVYGAEKTERDVKSALVDELGLGTELNKGIEMAMESGKNVYAVVYTWFAGIGITILDYLINVLLFLSRLLNGGQKVKKSV